MDNKVHLITEQDIHAYIDGELSGERKAAVEKFLAERDLPLERAARYLRNNFDLRAVRDEVYKDQKLKSEIERLLARRRPKRQLIGASG
jgi:anti-sigma factor RsiW